MELEVRTRAPRAYGSRALGDVRAQRSRGIGRSVNPWQRRSLQWAGGKFGQASGSFSGSARESLSFLSPATVVVMQSTEDRVRDNLFCSVQLIRLSWAGDMLLDSLVRSTVVEVGLVFFDGPIEVALAEDEAEVQALSADTAQESFASRVGLGCLERSA